MNTMTRQEQYRQQVLSKLINETNVIYNENINWYNIELPFYEKGKRYSSYIEDSEVWMNHHPEKITHKQQFSDYVTNNYGILFCEVDELWQQYTRYVTDLHISLGKEKGII